MVHLLVTLRDASATRLAVVVGLVVVFVVVEAIVQVELKSNHLAIKQKNNNKNKHTNLNRRAAGGVVLEQQTVGLERFGVRAVTRRRHCHVRVGGQSRQLCDKSEMRIFMFDEPDQRGGVLWIVAKRVLIEDDVGRRVRLDRNSA